VDPRLAPILALAATGTLAAIFWLWLGRAHGSTKRVAWRIFLFMLATALVAVGRSQGLFSRASLPFDLALSATVILVVIGNLYSVRFCTRCGRMHRNFKLGVCARCGDALPQHGFTEAPRRAPIDPTDPLGRKKRS
jgi:hypothetical protein